MVRVKWLGDGPEHLIQAQALRLGRTPDDEFARRFEICGRLQGRPGEVRLGLEGIEDRDAAEALRGSWVLGDPRDLAKLPPGEHYWYELVGCRVETRGGEPIGTVKEIWQTGAHDVLVIEGSDGRRVLLPAVDEFLREIDVAGRRLVIEAIPGLLDPV
jgi:16S rRNA processing protein RimM